MEFNFYEHMGFGEGRIGLIQTCNNGQQEVKATSNVTVGEVQGMKGLLIEANDEHETNIFIPFHNLGVVTTRYINTRSSRVKARQLEKGGAPVRPEITDAVRDSDV